MNKQIRKQLINYFLIILGTFLLAFGSVIFLTESELVAGGVSGIAIIIQHFVNFPIYDIMVASIMSALWLLGLIFVGKDFALKTLLSSLLYIGFTFMLTRVPLFTELAREFAGKTSETGPQIGNLILCGIFGGVFVGGGVAITFLGGGSTGGVDVFQIMFRKYFKMKESLTCFLVDLLVIIIGMASMRLWNAALCGMLSCVITALVIEAVYSKKQSAYQADIISEKWQAISLYAQEELGRGATIIKAEGGYKGDERIILRVVFDKAQYEELKQFIAEIDPKAFVTYTQTNAVYGEGFYNHKAKKLSAIKKEVEKYKKEKK